MIDLSCLFPRVRGEILRLLFGEPGRQFHLRELARLADAAPAAMQRELARLSEAGLLVSRRDGNRLYFRAETSHPLFPELRGLVLKTSGAVAAIRRALEPIEGIEVAFLFGSIAAGTDTPASDIDLLVIGTAGLRRIAPVLRPLTETLGREINPFCMTRAEWREKLDRRDAFVSRIASEPKIWLKNNADALAAMGR